MLRYEPRVVIVGTSCAGKTTLARTLSSLLQRPHIELDELYWGPNWTPRDDFKERVHAATLREAWIADGNYGHVQELLWKRATLLVWLNYPLYFVFGRALKRTLTRIVTGELMYANNRESFKGSFLERDGIPWWVLRTHRRRARQISARLRGSRFQHLSVIELRSHAETVAFCQREREDLR